MTKSIDSNVKRHFFLSHRDFRAVPIPIHMEVAGGKDRDNTGSDSDLPKVKGCFTVLEDFGVDFEIISSAHRTPEQTRTWVNTARDRGIRAIIAIAGALPICRVSWHPIQLCR